MDMAVLQRGRFMEREKNSLLPIANQKEMSIGNKNVEDVMELSTILSTAENLEKPKGRYREKILVKQMWTLFKCSKTPAEI